MFGGSTERKFADVDRSELSYQGIEANVFIDCTGFSLEKRLVTLRKLGERQCFPSGWGHVFPKDVGFGSRRGFSLACPVEAHAHVQYHEICENIFF